MDVSIQTHSKTIKRDIDNSLLPDMVVKSMEYISWYIAWGRVKNLLCARHFSFKPPNYMK